MRRTIGPCRATNAAKAASAAVSSPALNRSSSWASDRPAIEPPSKSDSMCRVIVRLAARVMPVGSVAMILDFSHPTYEVLPSGL